MALPPLPPEEALKLEDLLENIDDLVILATPEGKILYVNRAWREKLGYSQDEIHKINAHDVLHPMQHRLVAANEAKLLAGETLRDIQRTFVAKDGREFFVEGFLNYKFKEGKPEYVRAVFRDITERKKAEQMKDELVALATHELRSPLTAIIGSLELAKRHPDSAPKMLEMALRNSQFMLSLINDYLSVEKLSSGGAPLNLQSLELAPLLERALETNRALGAKAGVSFELSGAPAGLKVSADPERLTQVLTNLLSNAVKFSPENGKVTASLSRGGGFVRVAIADRGPGIPEAFRDKIFGRFAQAEGHRKGGSGLGLAISKAIVERHGGKIGFSTSSGAGTTFYFELPEAAD
ncbi:MAG: PAS domain S-box protein [Elusimicrobia bacterium]|nr:PAS domain S-box protein [Elusimicrobiota bacterium]